MEMKAQVTVRGFKTFIGAVDGQNIDSGKIYVDVDLKGENSAGTCTEEIKCVDSKVIQSIKEHKPPFLAELSIEMKSNGKTSTQVCTAAKALSRAAGSKPEA